LTKTQSVNDGTLTLTGNNTYTGATTVAAGTLALSGAGALSDATAVNITGGSFTINGITSTGETIGSLAGAAGTTVALGNKTLTTANNGSTTFSGVISGAGGSLTKNGTGTLTLNGSNSYTGGTRINGGNIQMGNATALGTTGNITFAGGGLQYGSGIATDISARIKNSTQGVVLIDTDNNDVTFANAVDATNTQGLTKNGTGTLTLDASNTYNGSTIINGGTLQLGNGGTSGSLSVHSAITNNGTLVFNRSNNVVQGTDFHSSAISGTGNLTQNGSGNLTLNQANTYTGTTTINSGTLQAAATGALGNSTVINVNGGSFLVTAANAVNDSAAINLGGGTMAVSGNFNETVGLLTLRANSTIDLAGYNGTLRFSGVGLWDSGANLAIWNWNGIAANGDTVGSGVADRRVVFTNNSNLGSYLTRISFYSGSGTGFAGTAFEQGFSGGGGGTEIIPVPEAETYFCALALLGGVAFYYLRRRTKRDPLGHHPA
jgi:autotransporter-associated beta strand protein